MISTGCGDRPEHVARRLEGRSCTRRAVRVRADTGRSKALAKTGPQDALREDPREAVGLDITELGHEVGVAGAAGSVQREAERPRRPRGHGRAARSCRRARPAAFQRTLVQRTGVGAQEPARQRSRAAERRRRVAGVEPARCRAAHRPAPCVRAPAAVAASPSLCKNQRSCTARASGQSGSSRQRFDPSQRSRTAPPARDGTAVELASELHRARDPSCPDRIEQPPAEELQLGAHQIDAVLR